MGMGNGTATVENRMALVKQLNIQLPCDPAIPLPDTYPQEIKAGT